MVDMICMISKLRAEEVVSNLAGDLFAQGLTAFGLIAQGLVLRLTLENCLGRLGMKFQPVEQKK